MGVNVHINYEADFSELTNRFDCFSFLKNIRFPNDEKHRWTTNDKYWNYSNKTTYEIQVMFIGKTGYGKSTTLNRIVGKNVFETNDVNVCTKDLYNAMYRINAYDPAFFVISDLPGVGESNYADNHYFEWYREMLILSDVVVYVLRADQRDFAIDEMIIKNMFDSSSREKLIFAINYADKIEPINRKPGLSAEQIQSLNKKIADVSNIFKIKKENIIYYSATDNINIDILAKKIANKIRTRFYP